MAGPDLALLCAPVPLETATSPRARFEVAAGETLRLRAHPRAFAPGRRRAHRSAKQALDETERFWKAWSARCSVGGEWAGAGAPLAHHAEGAHLRADRRHRRRADHLAAREIGGVRNWDYRYCWLRDATLTPARAHGLPATTTRRAPGANGWCARSPAAPSRCRSCTASPASGACPSRDPVARRLRGLQAGAHRQRRRRRSSSSTSTAS